MRFLPRNWWSIFPLCVLALLLAHSIALIYRIDPNTSLWFPPSGVAIALTLWFGPVGIAATALASILAAPHWQLHGWMSGLGAIDALEPLIAWGCYRHLFRGSLHFLRLREAIAFILSGPICASAVSAGVWTLALQLLRVTSTDSLLTRILYWWVGNAIGTIAIAPLALIYLTPRLQQYQLLPETSLPPTPTPTRPQIGQWLAILSLCIVTSTLTVIQTRDSAFIVQQLSFLSFIPILWAATRFGIQGGLFSGSLCVFVALLTYPLTETWTTFPQYPQILFIHKLSLLVQCAVGFLMGCVTTERAMLSAALAQERLEAQDYQARIEFNEQLLQLNQSLADANARLERSNQEQQATLHERQQIEDSLRQSEVRFARLAKNVPGVIYQYSQDGRDSLGEFTYLSPVCQEVFELDPQAVLDNASLMWQVVHPEDISGFRESILQVVQSYWETGQLSDPRPQWRWEWRIITPSGQLKWIQGIAHAEEQPDGTLLWDGLLLDISDRKVAEFALQASEAKFRRLVEANIFGVAIGKLSGQVTYANDAFLQMIRYSQADLAANAVHWESLTPPEYYPTDTQIIRELRESGVSTPCEKEYFRKDGSRVPVLVGAALLLEQFYDSQSLHPDHQTLIGFYLDLSDRKQVERALRESEERLHLILDASALGMWYCDLPLNVLICNKTCKEHFGLPPEGEVTIDLFYACLHPDDRETTRQGIEKAIANRTPYDAEFRTRGPDGHLRWVRAKGQIFNDPTSGRPYRFDGITIDITAAKQAEAERELLLARRSQYALQLHGLTRASMVMNASLSVESVLRSITEQARAIIGAHQAIARVTLNGETSISCSLAERYAAWRGAEHHLELLHLQSDEPLTQSVRMTQAELSRDPRWQTLAQQQYSLPMQGWLAAPLRIQGDRLIGIVQLSEKIEGEFNEEDEAIILQLAQMAAVAIENTRLYEAEQRARTHAEEANRIKDEFLAVLSHELRTPLNPILGWIKLLRTRQMDEVKVARALETIERNALLQAQLIEDLLDVSRILRGKINLIVSAVNLQAVVEAALDMVRLAAQAKGIEIDTQFVSPLPTISGDPNRLQQVVCNLLSNAVKFTPNGGRVSVQLWADGSFVKIQIQDNGAGINPHFLPYVFDYFRQQNSSSNRAFGGLGLGLAIVRYLVELHGGTAIAQSPGEGQGAIFTVAFPLVPPSSNDFGEAAAPVELASTPAFSSLQGLRILVVDDEVDTRELLIFTLEQYGAQVLAVGSARVAINCIASSESQFDLLLSDIGMPEMDGYQLIQQVRALPPTQGGNILAIALTAYAGQIDRQQILQAGFQAHLAKPIEPAALAIAIVNLLASQSQFN
ncbi:MASE1 domain-containing protein [Desertifilum sp. FACHB-1129]|uniref:histidine kinase n=1 Tax=Desertifilum tharense IPPAS B-1220 TaxID=1781255 RepID=A0A1E5QEM5_9CYAN|nr:MULTISPECIES: PAS domain-containing protein [Desertifilum]MDA0213414.1 MASE1 domain-containing protein [Cyanobacteria bacterium FC1]MBD2314903.1 MASE1 domain-containing protein [Desertifilum sp. FACHB-1129]MBD2322895.1 MASE1 domain-containing protein [Desertifilum sp. FACHB-866]MBD2335292.1 MASE1 domain-containing protein [Desertifilum sp. FACHB-868]OEJ73044.1 hypothetical protein BH720_21895 [Desertifilum tharense IPPAS B-1220]